MTTPVSHIVTALALGAQRETRLRVAIDMVLLGSKLRAAQLADWWQWSVYLAAGVTIGRIYDFDN